MCDVRDASVADDLLHRECNGRDRRIEGGREFRGPRRRLRIVGVHPRGIAHAPSDFACDVTVKSIGGRRQTPQTLNKLDEIALRAALRSISASEWYTACSISVRWFRRRCRRHRLKSIEGDRCRCASPHDYSCAECSWPQPSWPLCSAPPAACTRRRRLTRFPIRRSRPPQRRRPGGCARDHRAEHRHLRITRRPAPHCPATTSAGGAGVGDRRRRRALERPGVTTTAASSRRTVAAGNSSPARSRRNRRGHGRSSTSPTSGSCSTTARRARSISGCSATRATSISGTSTRPTRTPSASRTPFSSGRTFNSRNSSRRFPDGS